MSHAWMVGQVLFHLRTRYSMSNMATALYIEEKCIRAGEPDMSHEDFAQWLLQTFSSYILTVQIPQIPQGA